MRERHPQVQFVLDATRALRHHMVDVREEVEKIVARRPSPSGLVIPEVDAFGQLRDLYLAPGTCSRFGNQELVVEIMAAIDESIRDARRQYRIRTSSSDGVVSALAEVMEARWPGVDPSRVLGRTRRFGDEQGVNGGKD